MPDGGSGQVDGLSPVRAAAALASVPAGAVVASGCLVCADELPDGVVVADHAARVAVFNKAAVRLTGVASLNALGRDVRQVLPLCDADGRSWWTCVDPYRGLSTRTRHPETSLYLADGTELLVTVGYVRGPRCREFGNGPHGEPGAVQRIVITLRGAQQRARLERRSADLVSTVAHELRSPLTSVKGFTATLLAKWTRFTDDQKRVMLETVNADADRVTRLITELLDVSRIAAGHSPDRFRIEAPADLPETWLDADKVDQILGNLVENAVRHGAGTVTVVVEPVETVGARAVHRPDGIGATPGSVGAGSVAVSVRDEGYGVAPELVPRIFRQFWRAKRRGGAGLGLYIVKGLVEAHGGTITVQRAPGGGAEFRFTVPAGGPDFG